MIRARHSMTPRTRTTLLLAGALALAALAALALVVAPDALGAEANQMDLVRSLAVLALLGMALAARPIRAAFAFKAAVVWIAIAAVLALGYLHKETLLGLLP